MFMDENAPPTYYGINNSRNLTKEQYKTQIAINTKKLELLEHKKLVELIQLIKDTCDLYLNDYKYADKTYGIFKIIKKKESKGYDIIIDDNNNKIQEEEKYKRDKIEDEKYYDIEEEEEEKEEEEEEEEYNNSINGRIKNENSLIKEKQIKNCINFKTIKFNKKERQNNIEYNYNQGNKIFDCNKPNFNSGGEVNIFKEKNNINKSPFFNDASPIPNIINDSSSEDEYDEDEEEKNKKKIIQKNNKNYIKCTDCDLVYATIEQMIEHHYNIHGKNKIKEQIKTKKERTKSKKKEINKNFEQWAESRKEIKSNKNEKLDTKSKSINKKINEKDLNQNQNKKKKIIDEEEEKIKEKFLSDLENLFQLKGIKIRKKMKKISNQKRQLIKNIKLKENGNNQEDLTMKYQEINKIIKERREEEIKKIKKEINQKIKELKAEKKKKLIEIKLNKQKNHKLKQQEEEKRKSEEIKRK